jgi:hypothetical protein
MGEWNEGFSFPKFKFDLEQLSTKDFWCAWIKEFLATLLFSVGVAAFGGNPLAWGLSYLTFSCLFSGAHILSPLTFQATMSSGNLISGLFTFAAQAMATNLACCSDFQSWTGISNDFSATGFAFSDLFGSVAVFEFVTVMIYFFLQNKGCGDALPTWFFKTMLVTSVFWMNKDAIFTPARIWTGEMNFATVFGTYLNNFAAVFFGVNLSHYAFKQ